MKHIALVAVCLACCVAAGHARQAQRPRPAPAQGQRPAPAQQSAQFRAGVDLVEVDVAVLDQDRQPVRGLLPTDFTILENKLPQNIVAFSEVEVPEAVEPPTVWMREVTPDVKTNSATDRRLIVLVLDDAMVDPRSPYTTARVKEIGHSIVDHLGPSDLATVIYTLDERKSQEFTSDRERLLAAVDRFTPGFGTLPPPPPPVNTAGVGRNRNGGGAPRQTGGPSGSAAPSNDLFETYPLNTIDKIAEYLADVPLQRKTLIYVSPGVPVDMTTLKPAAPGTFGDPGGHTSAMLSEMQDMFRKAQRANVSVYGIDPNGLQGADSDPGGINPARDMLQTLSTNTGGFALINNNEFNWGITQIFKESSSYYLIGYQSPNTAADGKLRPLEVKVNRPGVTVHARNGYYAPKAASGSTAAPVVPPLARAISGLVPLSGMQMRVDVAPFAIAGKDTVALAIVLGLQQPAPHSDSRVTETVNLVTRAFDGKGEQKGVRREDAQVVLRSGADGEIRYEVLSRLDLKPGHYQLRLGAYSASLNRTGSIFTDVDVPDFSKGLVSLSGVLLDATPAIVSGPKGGLSGLAPIVPTTQREFAGHASTAFLRIYQGGKKALTDINLMIRIVDGSDTPVVEKQETVAASRFGADRSADYTFELPLTTLKPGPYLLTFDAVTQDTKSTLTHRDLRFFVR